VGLMSYKIIYDRNPHQKELDEDLTSPLLHVSTGFGGGKTYGLCMKLLKLSILNAPYGGGLVVPSYKEYKRDVAPELQNILDKNKIPYKYNKTDFWYTFPWSKGKLQVVSAENEIRGDNWAYAGINEVTLIPLMRYKETIGRVRVKGAKCPQIVSVGTPEGYVSEYYDYMIEKPPKGLRIIYGSTDDNSANLGDFYLKNLEDSYDAKMIEAYRKGLWVNMSEARFYYSYDPKKCFDTTLKLNDFDSFHISMDFNVDPYCATVWGTDGYTLFGLTQIELKGAEGYSTENMIRALQSRGFVPNNTIIYPDPAGNARSTKGKPDIVQLKEAGYEVRHKGVAPRFRTRQLNVNNLLDKSRIKFNPNECKGIKKDFEGVEQDKITLEKLKSNPNLTHFSDGLDCMCDILFPFSGNAKGVSLVTYR
jgi:hypothetical protein